MSETFTPDKLFAGVNQRPVAKQVVIAAGQGALARGAVLGKITKAIAAAVADAGNTGDGTCTLHVLGSKAKIGTYTITCITAALNGGTFSVIDPDGIRLADAVVGVAYAGPVGFVVNDGNADFIVGDSFTIEVSEPAAEEYAIATSTAVNGSQDAECILAEDVDATLAAVTTAGYFTGEFNEAALTFGGADTADLHRDSLRNKGIFLRTTVPA
jgi:hypothetical protein